MDELRIAKPEILKVGDPDCIHHENIHDEIGTCVKCGRIKRYHSFEINPDNLIKSRKGGVSAQRRKR